MNKDKGMDELISLIKSFNKQLKKHLPALKMLVIGLIKEKTKNKNEIENTLERSCRLPMHGVGGELFIKLFEYYKTVDARGAAFYGNAYDKQLEA